MQKSFAPLSRKSFLTVSSPTLGEREVSSGPCVIHRYFYQLVLNEKESIFFVALAMLYRISSILTSCPSNEYPIVLEREIEFPVALAMREI